MKNRVREIWLGYRSEGLFGLVLMVCAAVSHRLSYYIPEELFDGVITAIQNTCTATVCFFGAVLMFVHSEGIRIRKAWGWVLLIWGLFDTFFLIQTYFLHMPVLNIGDDAMSAFQLLVANLLAWLLLVYPQEAIRPNWLTFPKAMLQLLPMCALVGLDYLLPVDLSYVIMCYPVLLGVILARHVRAYRLWCERNFSTMDNIDVQWIVRYLVMLLVLGLSLFYMCLTDNPARAFTQQWLLLLLFGYSTVQILFRPDPWKQLRSTAEKEPEEPNPSKAAYRAALEAWLEKEKPYCNPDFQLQDLRQVLPLNRTYLSQLINSEYGCSFYQWVNDLRIKEAKRLMTEQPDLKIQDVAERCGFSSRRMFTQVFARETGTTPTEWFASQNNPK
ncbi:MAG: AraC family transcriptional regulator [Alphaproteobacteria bacterium]|nr:AraC family transcriptional regulator [Alphaproteobacteria bacterium]